MATISTDQGTKDVVSPGTGEHYTIKIIWDLDPVTLVPVGIRQEITPA
jgi:hypothetical protein